jgi:hypothetical protein
MADTANRLENTKFVFGAVLPLLASWVGTILAFYFSKDNFLAATQSVTDLAKTVTATDKLRAIPVREKMRPVNLIECEAVATGAEDLSKLADLLTRFDKVERMLIVEAKASPVVRYLIYKSIVNEYISQLAQQKAPMPAGKTAASVTLKDLLAWDPKKTEMFSGTFGVVGENATLADAKAQMDKIDKCNDVLVTKNGVKTEPILGWITDNTIAENARV